MKKGNGVKNWSLSALQVYESCPARYKAERIDKIGKKVSVPAMERGTAIHAKGERYLLKDIPNVPKEYKPFADEMRNLRKAGAIPEKKMAFNRKWKPVAFGSSAAWVRMVIDVQLPFDDGSVFLIDFKTGRIYPDKHDDQGHLYATVHLPEYPKVDVEFWYLDQDDIRKYSFNDGCLKEYQQYWEDRVAPLFADTKWETSPSKFDCKWCVKKEICPDAVR